MESDDDEAASETEPTGSLRSDTRSAAGYKVPDTSLKSGVLLIGDAVSHSWSNYFCTINSARCV